MSSVDEADVLLVYDKECPACDQYVRVMRVREIDSRHNPASFASEPSLCRAR